MSSSTFSCQFPALSRTVFLTGTVMWSFETHPKIPSTKREKAHRVWIKTQSAASIKIQSHGFLSVSHSWGGNANYLHSHPQPIACLDNPWARHLGPITARQRWNSSTRARWESCMCSPVGVGKRRARSGFWCRMEVSDVYLACCSSRLSDSINCR